MPSAVLTPQTMTPLLGTVATGLDPVTGTVFNAGQSTIFVESFGTTESVPLDAAIDSVAYRAMAEYPAGAHPNPAITVNIVFADGASNVLDERAGFSGFINGGPPVPIGYPLSGADLAALYGIATVQDFLTNFQIGTDSFSLIEPGFAYAQTVVFSGITVTLNWGSGGGGSLTPAAGPGGGGTLITFTSGA